MVNLKIKLVLEEVGAKSKCNYQIAAATELSISASCSARNLRGAIRLSHGLDASHLVYSGKKVSLYGKEPMSYDPFLLRHGIIDNSELFILCQQARKETTNRSRLEVEFGVQTANGTSPVVEDLELIGVNSPLIDRKTRALGNKSQVKYAVYRLVAADLRAPLFSLTKTLARMFRLQLAKTRLLFGGNDLSSSHHSPSNYGAQIGSEFWVLEDESLMEVHPVILNIVLPTGIKGTFECEKFDANVGKRTTVSQLQKKLAVQFDPEHKMEFPRIFYGGTELKSYMCISEKGLAQSARIDVIFSPQSGVERVSKDINLPNSADGPLYMIPDSLVSQENAQVLSSNTTNITPEAKLDEYTKLQTPRGPMVNNTSDRAGMNQLTNEQPKSTSLKRDQTVLTASVPPAFESYSPFAHAKPEPWHSFEHKNMESIERMEQFPLSPGLIVPSTSVSWCFTYADIWHTFPSTLCADLEAAYANGHHKFSFTADGQDQTIYFDFNRGRTLRAPHVLVVGEQDLDNTVGIPVRRDKEHIDLLRWECFDERSEMSGVFTYDGDVAERLEAAFQNSGESCKYQKNGTTYIVEFSYSKNKPHIDRNMDTNEVREVRRHIFKLGDELALPFYENSHGAIGTLKYIGPAKTFTLELTEQQQSRPIIAGVELDAPMGEHDGTDEDGTYFHTKRMHGVTCLASLITKHFKLSVHRRKQIESNSTHVPTDGTESDTSLVNSLNSDASNLFPFLPVPMTSSDAASSDEKQANGETVATHLASSGPNLNVTAMSGVSNNSLPSSSTISIQDFGVRHRAGSLSVGSSNIGASATTRARSVSFTRSPPPKSSSRGESLPFVDFPHKNSEQRIGQTSQHNVAAASEQRENRSQSFASGMSKQIKLRSDELNPKGAKVILQGKLLKRSHGKKWGVAYDWQARLFIVTENDLTYYKTTKFEKRKKGVDGRKEMRVIKCRDIKAVEFLEQKKGGKANLICIAHSDGELICQCRDEYMRTHWVTELKRIVKTQMKGASDA